MDRAGTPPHRKDECNDRDCDWHGARSGTPNSPKRRPSLTVARQRRPDRERRVQDLPIQTARADAARRRDCLPFVLQAGRTLFIVTEDAHGWVLAELRFDPHACIFIEQSCARFDWPREALGRLLSRVLVAEIDQEVEFTRVADDFQDWLALQFVA